jgi:hypothetical protein
VKKLVIPDKGAWHLSGEKAGDFRSRCMAPLHRFDIAGWLVFTLPDGRGSIGGGWELFFCSVVLTA